jgi:hypothetical protein
MHTLFKPNGTEVKVNDTSLVYALKLGWTKENPTAKKAVKSGNSTKRNK